MTVETLFDLIQIPTIGLIVVFMAYRQQLKTQPEKASRVGLFTGIGGAAFYAALKFLF